MKVGDLVIPHEKVAPALQGAHWSGVVLKRYALGNPANRWLVAWTVTELTGRVIMHTSHHPQMELQIISE